jgi:hypothetical protein
MSYSLFISIFSCFKKEQEKDFTSIGVKRTLNLHIINSMYVY